MKRIIMFFRKISHRSNWGIHKSQVLQYVDIIGYGTFDDFIREYNKREWDRDHRYDKSHFGKDSCREHNEIHARIIKFGGIGMILDLESYVKFHDWVKKHQYVTCRLIQDDFNQIKPLSSC